MREIQTWTRNIEKYIWTSGTDPLPLRLLGSIWLPPKLTKCRCRTLWLQRLMGSSLLLIRRSNSMSSRYPALLLSNPTKCNFIARRRLRSRLRSSLKGMRSSLYAVFRSSGRLLQLTSMRLCLLCSGARRSWRCHRGYAWRRRRALGSKTDWWPRRTTEIRDSLSSTRPKECRWFRIPGPPSSPLAHLPQAIQTIIFLQTILRPTLHHSLWRWICTLGLPPRFFCYSAPEIWAIQECCRRPGNWKQSELGRLNASKPSSLRLSCKILSRSEE